MLIKVQKTPQVEFPASKFPTDTANVASRDAKCARERYLAKRFRLAPHLGALVAELAFQNGRVA